MADEEEQLLWDDEEEHAENHDLDGTGPEAGPSGQQERQQQGPGVEHTWIFWAGLWENVTASGGRCVRAIWMDCTSGACSLACDSQPLAVPGLCAPRPYILLV